MKRLRKLAKLAVISALVLSAILAVIIWRDSAKREAMVSSIREAGDPVSITDLRPTDVASETNAATYLTPVTEDLQTLVFKIYPFVFPEAFDRQSGLTDQQRAESEKLFAAHTKVDEAIQRASQCKALHWPLDYADAPSKFMESLLNNTQSTRDVARFHVAKSRTLADGGDPDKAIVVCLQGLRLVRLQDQTPTMIASMVNSACRATLLDEVGRVIRHHKLKPETHQAIEAELSNHNSLAAFVQALKSERAFGLSSINGFSSIPGTRWITGQVSNYVEYMDEQITLSSDWPYQQSQVETVQTFGMTDLLVPAVSRAREAYLRTIAVNRSARVLNAIHSLDPAALSPTIDELGLPAEATIDPFSGNALVIKKTETGWTVYSVGPNKKDDGGQVASDEAAPLDVGV